ncbi:MAG TPA: hypothetical protein VNF99_15630 [Stellaceae bacterium]|nr:hypothetical protein [Stellaceae bacterium]
MANAIEVSDSISNLNEQLEVAAKAVGRSEVRRKVFSAIYYHKAKRKTVSQIVERTKLPRLRVLQEARHLARKGVVRQVKVPGAETAYEMIEIFHAHKPQILSLAGNPKKLADLPTKRKLRVASVKVVTIPATTAKVRQITIDDVQSFAKVRKVSTSDYLPPSLSEDRFKRGVQAIVGEPGKFKDWGGEKSDLYTTRLRINGKRIPAAFAFKGPGLKGKLVPGKMGKNGDQAQRLLQEEAQVFFVQHWREIDPSVADLLQRLATAKSVTNGSQIMFGIIDGNDSERLRLAYPDKFGRKSRR